MTDDRTTVMVGLEEKITTVQPNDISDIRYQDLNVINHNCKI